MNEFTHTYTATARVIDDRFVSIDVQVAGQFLNHLVDTEDKLIREGLIKIGWLPPEAFDRLDVPFPDAIQKVRRALYLFGPEVEAVIRRTHNEDIMNVARLIAKEV